MGKDLAEAKRALTVNPTLETNKAFGDSLAAAVKNGEWIAVPVIPDERGNRLVIQANQGLPYVVFFTDEEHYHFEKGMSLMMTDINKIIDSIYESPHLGGFVLDPYTSPIFITREQLSDCTCRQDPRRTQRDWGKGIPEYSKNDLMTSREVQQFALQIAQGFGLMPGGFEVIESTLDPQEPFSFAARKGGQLYFVLVTSSVAPQKASLSPTKKQRLLAFAEKHNAKAIYIPVGIGACDSERFAAGLALVGDAYFSDYHGMYEASKDGSLELIKEEQE